MVYNKKVDLGEYFSKKEEKVNVGTMGNTLMKSFPDLRPELAEKTAEPIEEESEQEKPDGGIFIKKILKVSSI